LNEVANAYVFQCLTGFAYQDLYGLCTENIILVGPLLSDGSEKE